MFKRNLKFYDGLTKKYVAIFGNLFNDIWIDRSDGTNPEAQTMKVPLGFGPREKYLAKNTEDADGSRDVAITLPRMSYEIINWSFDPDRNLNPLGQIRAKENTANTTTYATVRNPVPYNIYFELSIMTKTVEDGLKIMEQILPYFKPAFTVSAKLFPELPDYERDIQIVLNNVDNDDDYKGQFMERRTVVWILSFTMKAYYFEGITQAKKIKIAFTNIYPGFSNTVPYFQSEIYPGLTANGQPTTDPNTAIDPHLVNEQDNWDYVIIKQDIIDDA